MTGFTGTVSAAAGASAQSSSVFVSAYSGSIALSGSSFIQPFSLVYGNATTSNQGGGFGAGENAFRSKEYLDVVMNYEPMRLVQVIFTSGTGPGMRNYTTGVDTYAVVRGTWSLGYRHLTSTTALSSQASAAQVAAVLQALPLPELQHITVTRTAGNTLPTALQAALMTGTGVTAAALNNGWAWQVTFFDETSLTHFAPLVVSTDPPNGLYTAILGRSDAAIHVQTLTPALSASLLLANSSKLVGPYDAPANYSSSDLQSMLTFHGSGPGGLLGPLSVGWWANYKILRVVPNRPAPWRLQPLVGVVSANVSFPLPTKVGIVVGFELPVLRYHR